MIYKLWSSWANIPWKYKPIKEKIHITLLGSIFLFMIFYICVGFFVLYNKKVTPTLPSEDSIAILLDTSFSMTATDVSPNRYQHALALATGLIQKYPAQYTVLPFGSVPLIRVPFSSDFTGISHVIGQYSLGSYQVNESYMGSAPGNAIGLARSMLRTQPTKNKTILLLGDGNTNTGLTIDTFIPHLQQDNIQLLICAIGQPGYILGTNYLDAPVISEIDTKRLDILSEATDGKRWICNNIPESIDRIIMRLKENTVINTHTTSNAYFSQIRNNFDLHIIMIFCIIYIIITTIGSIVFYELYRFVPLFRKKTRD